MWVKDSFVHQCFDEFQIVKESLLILGETFVKTKRERGFLKGGFVEDIFYPIDKVGPCLAGRIIELIRKDDMPSLRVET